MWNFKITLNKEQGAALVKGGKEQAIIHFRSLGLSVPQITFDRQVPGRGLTLL